MSTLRQRLWKVGAVVVSGVRHIGFHLSETWPNRELLGRVLAAVSAFVVGLPSAPSAVGSVIEVPPM